MAMEVNAARERRNIGVVWRYLKYKFKFTSEHPDYFDADGLLVFVGSQGTGKTLSAVNYVYKLMTMYPNCKLVTNLILQDYPIVTFKEFVQDVDQKKFFEFIRDSGMTEQEIEKQLFDLYLQKNRVFPFENNDDFSLYDNGEKGVIYLVDEIQLYMNSLESKNINIDVIAQIAQQRKQRKHIVATSQVFGRLAKPLREQFSNVVVCRNILGFIQLNKLVDRDGLESDNSTDTNITGSVRKTFLWFHDPRFYGRYETYYVIKRDKFVSAEKRKGDIYDGNSQFASDN